MKPHYQSNKSIQACREDGRLLKNASGISLPPSTRSYNPQKLLTEEPTPQQLLIPASQFEDDDSQDYISPPGRPLLHSQFYVNSPGTPGESIISAPGGKMTMMDRLQQNHQKMIHILADLPPLKSDYTMDELCYLLMDHCEALIDKINTIGMVEDQEYLSTLNRRLMEEIQGLRKEKKKQEGNRTRAEVQTEYIEKQLEHSQKQVQEYKSLLAKSGIDVDKKLAELERKDKEELKSMKFLIEQQNANLALKNDELKKLKAKMAHSHYQQTDDQDRVVAPLMDKIQQQKDYIGHLQKRLKEVITASKLEFPLYTGQVPFGTFDSPTSFLNPAEIRNNQEGIKNLVVNEFEKDTMFQVFMNQASTIESLLQSEKQGEVLPGRLTNVFNQATEDESQDLEESKKQSVNVLLQEKYDILVKERDVLQKAINEAIQREGKLNQQYKEVLDLMQTMAGESLKAITAEDQELFEYSDEQDSSTKKFLEEKSLQVPDPQFNRLAYLELIDRLFREQKFSLASKLWRRIGYEPMTHTSLERNNELLRLAIKLRDRNFKKQSKQIENLKGETTKVNSSKQYSKANSSRDNFIGQEYLMRNDSILTQNAKDSGNLITPQIREKLEEYEKLKKEHEEVKTAVLSGKQSAQAKQLQRIMSAKIEESEQELNEMLAYGPRLSSRESVFSLRESMKASKRPSMIFFQLQEQNSQLKEKLENLVAQRQNTEEDSPIMEQKQKKEESRVKEQERNIAIIDTIFANLSLVADQLQKGRSILKIPDLGDQQGLIKRTTTACEIAKQGKSNLLTTFNLLKELFSITGELERLMSEFVLHLQLGVSRKKAAEAMKNEAQITSPPKRDIFSSPMSSIKANQSPCINSPEFNSNAKTTSRIIGSPDKKLTQPACSSQRYTQQITQTKDKARSTYQNFLEADLKAPSELSQEHVRNIKTAFFDIYHLFSQMQKQSEALLLELAICEQRLSLQEDSARNGYELSQKLRECEQELAQWKQGYAMPQTLMMPGQLSASQSVEKDYLEKRITLLQRRADNLSSQNQNLQHKLNLKEEELRQKTQTAHRLENVINLRDERIKNLEAIVEDMKQDVEEAKEIESQISNRIRTRGGVGRAQNDLKRIVELERQRNKFRRELQRKELESKDLLIENQELKLMNQELTRDKQEKLSARDGKQPQIIYTHPSVLQHIPETSSVSDPQNESLANTTEVLCLSGSFMNSARKSNFNSPQRDRNSTFKSIKSQQMTAARECAGQQAIMSPTFSHQENTKLAGIQQKYEKTIKMLEDTINEHKKVIREERTQAALEKESLQQQLFNVVSQLEAIQNSEEDRQDFAQMYYVLVEKIELIRNMLQPVGESVNSSPARSQRMRSQTGGSEYIVKHIQKRIKELQQKLITYEGLIDKAIQRVGGSTSTPGQIQEVELLRSQNKLLRERIEVSQQNVRRMEQYEEEQQQIISSLDLNRDEVVKEYMRQVVALLQEHGLDEGLVIENVRVKDLFQRVIKLVHQLKNEIQKQFQDINDASLALSQLRAQGALQSDHLGLSFDEMRKLVRAENAEKLRDQELQELQQEMELKREENKRLQGQLALSQNAEQIESMKSRQTLIHYASQIDKLRQEILKLKNQNTQLLTFKQKTSQELLALIHRLREEKQLQQSMSAQLQNLTQELKQVRQEHYGDSPMRQKSEPKQFYPQVDDIGLQKNYGADRLVKGMKAGHQYRRSGQFR